LLFDKPPDSVSISHLYAIGFSRLELDMRPIGMLFWGVLTAILSGLSGCHEQLGAEIILVQPSDYTLAFDASMEAAHESGMTVDFADRRSGVIQTEPRIAGSLLEPWRTDNASIGEATANTFAFRRRRARFEFIPANFEDSQASSQEPLAGPDLLNDDPLADLTQAAGPLELRVWVYLERADTVGLRRSTWTRTKTQVARIVDPDTGETSSGTHWTTVTRDRDYERALLGKVAQMLAAQQVHTGTSSPQEP
jgi:hypothetical protein